MLRITDITVPAFTYLEHLYTVDKDDNDTPKEESTGDCDCQDENYVMESESSQLFSQSELNDLVRDLSLSKESSQLQASRLKEKSLFLLGTRISFYTTSESKL